MYLQVGTLQWRGHTPRRYDVFTWRFVGETANNHFDKSVNQKAHKTFNLSMRPWPWACIGCWKMLLKESQHDWWLHVLPSKVAPTTSGRAALTVEGQPTHWVTKIDMLRFQFWVYKGANCQHWSQINNQAWSITDYHSHYSIGHYWSLVFHHYSRLIHH